MAGLTETQKNALAGLQAALGTAQFFGGKAADLALQANMSKDIDKALNKINEQHAAGAISDGQRSQLTESALRSMIGGGTTTSAEPLTTKEVQELTNTAGANEAAVSVSRPSGEQVSVDARSPSALSDATKTIIILPTSKNSPDARAFFPSRNDKSGAIELEADVRNAPAGSSFRWNGPDPAAITLDSPSSLRTRLRGLRPGRAPVDFTVSDAGGVALASVRIQLSIPQFVSISEDAAAFDAVLALIRLGHLKSEVLREARKVCDHLLSTSNVRTVWLLAPFSEVMPAHVPAANITALTIRGNPPSTGLLGRTNLVGGAAGAAVLNETIDLFPGGYDDPAAPDVEVDVETQALIIELESATMTDPALEAFAVMVYGRLIGETMAHEVVHSLLGFDIPTGHNVPDLPGDLMNHGNRRTFRQRTGIEDTAHSSPVDPVNFVDHGIAAIGGLTSATQALMDARFPVPPAFL